MTIRVVIKRKVKQGQQAKELVPLILHLTGEKTEYRIYSPFSVGTRAEKKLSIGIQI